MAAALCRILRQDGVSVAPFKAQNMSNNSWVAPQGGELGRAQALQAAAAGIEVSTDMNPVLLKPEADSRSQVVLNGRVEGSVSAAGYYRSKRRLWPHVTAALDKLRSSYEVVVIEGAGSPAELNLRPKDIANMSVALYASSPVMLVGDIDRGGVFASLLGTLELLEPDERELVRALVINRFRGDPAVLEPLPEMIAQRTGKPIAGVVPFIPGLRLPDEDAAALDGASGAAHGAESGLQASVIRLPRISNFDEFDPLARCGVAVDFVSSPERLAASHIVILPGTKSTIADLRWMKAQGIDTAVKAAAGRAAAVLGICGGFQMLGNRLDDPHGADSHAGDGEDGLGLLDCNTTFAAQKRTRRVEFRLGRGAGLLEGGADALGAGYEIHTGITTVSGAQPFTLYAQDGATETDGALSPSGWTLGTYVHGLLDSPEVTGRILGNTAKRFGLPTPQIPSFSVESELDRLAYTVRENLDMGLVYSLLDRGAGTR